METSSLFSGIILPSVAQSFVHVIANSAGDRYVFLCYSGVVICFGCLLIMNIDFCPLASHSLHTPPP